MSHKGGTTELHYFMFVVIRSEDFALGSVSHTEYDLCSTNHSFDLPDTQDPDDGPLNL